VAAKDRGRMFRTCCGKSLIIALIKRHSFFHFLHCLKVNTFSFVAARNYERRVLMQEHQLLCNCHDARIVCTMPSCITIMIFVPIRGGIAIAMRASERFILLRIHLTEADTNAGGSSTIGNTLFGCSCFFFICFGFGQSLPSIQYHICL